MLQHKQRFVHLSCRTAAVLVNAEDTAGIHAEAAAKFINEHRVVVFAVETHSRLDTEQGTLRSCLMLPLIALPLCVKRKADVDIGRKSEEI